MPEILAGLAAISALLAAVVGVITLIKKLAPTVQLIVGVFGDFAGTPARPGVEARPGVMERLASIDEKVSEQGKRIDSQGEQLAAIQHELHPNSGKSLRDSINRIEHHTKPLTDTTDAA